jgi:hypothetical protein
VTLDSSDSNDRHIGQKLDLITNVSLLGVETCKERLVEILLSALLAIILKPLVRKATVLADRSLPVVPQQGHEVPREAMGKIGAVRLMDNVGPLRFLWPFIPCFVDHYGCTIVGFYLWVVPEILEISGLVVNRFGLRSRTG